VGCGGGDDTASLDAVVDSSPLTDYDTYWQGLDPDQRAFQCQVFQHDGVQAPGARQLYEGMQRTTARFLKHSPFDEWSALPTQQCSD
jgi:hypothetical protein